MVKSDVGVGMLSTVHFLLPAPQSTLVSADLDV